MPTARANLAVGRVTTRAARRMPVLSIPIAGTRGLAIRKAAIPIGHPAQTVIRI